ncbi:MAG: HK97 family phage prohead protease [Rhodothermales bacterium]
MKHEIEIRSYSAKFTAGARNLHIFTPLYNERSGDLGGFHEVVRPGAFTASIRRGDASVFGRTDSTVLASARRNTLSVTDGDRGLTFTFKRSGKSEHIEGIADSVTLDMVVLRDAWSELRGVKLRELLDVSIVNVRPGFADDVLVGERAQKRVRDWTSEREIARRHLDALAAQEHRAARLASWPERLSVDEKRRLGIALTKEDRDRILWDAFDRHYG